jgi:hypothetical protein
LAKDITPLTKVAQFKTYQPSRKLSLSQDKSTYTCGEQQQLIELSSFSMLNIAIMTGYLAWYRKRVSHLISTHPSIMTGIVIQIQTSITTKAIDNLGRYEEM